MTTPGGNRERLRQTFNQAVGSYQRARPDYPSELFDDLIAVAGLAPGDRLPREQQPDHGSDRF